MRRVVTVCGMLVFLDPVGAAESPFPRDAEALRRRGKVQTASDEPLRLGEVRGGSSSQLASQQLSGVEVAIAGALARVVAQGVLHPLDVVRTRVQAKSVGGGRGAGVMTYGLAPQLLLAGPAGALQFVVTDLCRQPLEAHAPAAVATLLAAAIGTTAAASVRVPQELIKQGCMAELYPNAASATLSIWDTAGVAGFYRGARETVIRDVLWNSLSFAFFRRLADSRQAAGPSATNAHDDRLRRRRQYVDGILAGSLAALLTHPLDVLKTRVMTSRADATAAAADASVLAQLVALVRAEGPLVLLKGIVPRLLYLGPLASLVLATNELIATWILQARAPKQHLARAF